MDKLLTTLEEKKLSVKNLIEYAVDNAAFRMGDYNGAKAKLNINSDIFVSGCICHSLHLAASAAANVLPRQIERFCRDMYIRVGHLCTENFFFLVFHWAKLENGAK